MLFFSELESDFRYQRMEVGSLGELVGRLIVLFYSTALHQITCAQLDGGILSQFPSETDGRADVEAVFGQDVVFR